MGLSGGVSAARPFGPLTEVQNETGMVNFARRFLSLLVESEYNFWLVQKHFPAQDVYIVVEVCRRAVLGTFKVKPAYSY